MGEVDLKQILGVLLRRKLFIILFTIVCIMAAMAVNSFILKQKYEARAVYAMHPVNTVSGIEQGLQTTSVFTGKVSTTTVTTNRMLGPVLKQIDYPAVSVKDIIDLAFRKEFADRVIKASEAGSGFVYNTDVQIAHDAKNNSITVSVRNPDEKLALRVCMDIVRELRLELGYVLENRVNKAMETVSKGLEQEIRTRNDAGTKLSAFLSSVGGEAAVEALPLSRRDEYRRLKYNYELALEAIEAYDLAAKELNIIKTADPEKLFHFSCISDAAVSGAPVSPNKKANIAAAAVLGLLASVLSVFCLERFRR